MPSASSAADRAPAPTPAPDPAERGATMVELLAVGLLVVTALLTVAQLATWVWARNVAVNAAHEGARTAAEAGRAPREGADRTRELLRDGLGRGAASFHVRAAGDGQVVEVTASGRAPALVPFLPPLEVTARATAFDEDGGFS